MADQRLPIVGQDDGTWGDILRQFLMKEHVNDDDNHPGNGGHKNVTIAAGSAGAGGAPLKFTTGTLLTNPEAGAVEYAGNYFYITANDGTRKKIATDVDLTNHINDTTTHGATGAVVGTTNTQTLTNKTLADPTISGIMTIPRLDSITAPNNLTNANYRLSNTSGQYPAFSPVPKYLWHDTMRFNRHWGTPEYETYSGSWSSQTLNSALFSGREDQSLQVADGTTVTGVRWTWHSSQVSWSYAFWWCIGFTYVAGGSTKGVLVESSADGTEWTERHTSTTDANNEPVWLHVSNWGGDAYIRLTITATNSKSIELSAIKALTARWGDQGGGSEFEVPYSWDNDANITLGAWNAPRSNGLLNLGSTSPTSATEGIYFGTDTNLYRSATNTLKTDDNLIVGTAGTAAGSVATIDGSQTLTNKTLTSPTINGTTTLAGTLNFTPDSGNVLTFDGTPVITRHAGGQNKSIGIGGDDTVYIGAGESRAQMTTNITPGPERVEIGGDSGVNIYVSPDNWASSWAGRKTTAFTATGITWDGNEVWHAGNDGSGSGLDADTLDGKQASAFADATHTHTASQISDSTAIGRSVLTAASAAAARSAIGAGTGSGDVTLTGSQTLTNKTLDATNTVVLVEDNFQLQDNGDSTRKAEFNISSSQASGTTRIHTLPHVDSTLVGDTASQTLTNKTINGSNNNLSNISADSIVDGTTNHVFTAANDSKLAGIEAGANVTDAANVNAAGAVMNSDTSTSPMNFVVDEDNMASNSATKVPTQQSTKAYVDSGLAGKANTSHTHTASQISDSTSIGRSVLTASSAAAARSAIGAGTGDGNVTTTGAQVLTNKTISGDDNNITDLTATTALDATGTKSSSTFLRGDNTWATPPNTTYSEIPSAEIAAGTSSASRAISGRRAQEIVDKAVAASGDVTLNGNQTLKNKTIDGDDNTLTNIPTSAITGLDTDFSKLVCTTAQGSTGTENGANTWVKIATYSTGTSAYKDCAIILSVSNAVTSAHDTAIISVFFRSNSVDSNPIVDVRILAKGGNGSHILDDSFKVISGGWSSDMELWFKKGSTYGRFYFYETSRVVSGGTLTYTTNPAWQSAVPTGDVRNVSSDGVYSGLKLTADGTVTGTQLISTVSNGTAPLTVSSTTKVANLNADLLDDMSATSANTANTIVARDDNGDFTGRYVKSSYVNMNHSAYTRNNDTIFYSSGDDYIRKNTVSGFKTSLSIENVDNTADSSKNVLSATRLTTARTIGGVSFNGTANINLPGVNITGNQDTTGNAATATTATNQSGGTVNATIGDFSTVARTDELRTKSGQQLVLNAGESHNQATGQTGEFVYLNAESGLQINSSPDNWATGWAGRVTTVIDDAGITWNGNKVWHAGNDGSGSGLDADTVDGVHASALMTQTDMLTVSESLRANRNLNGGGIISVDGSFNVSWSSRFLVISNGRGSHFSTTGYFQIDCPTSGTITGVGGASDATVTSAGIPLGTWEALYYILPIGSGSGTVAANFRIARYTADADIPHDWLLICIRNGDNSSVVFNNGITLSAGHSMNAIQQSHGNTANTLVRRDGSGNFSAGTITANLNGNATTATSLQSSRTIRTNLASTSAPGFDGSANISPGVTGTLPVSHGGTGVTTLTGVVIGNGGSDFSAVAAPNGAIVGTSDNQILTNKTINGSDNNLTNISADSIVDGTTNHVFTAANDSKLAGIEAGANVTDAANVNAAGAVMNSDTSTSPMNFVVDEDNMASNSATKVPTQQSTKAYVDSGLAGKANTSHTHTASQISDSTSIGRSVLTASSAAAARSAIGAGTASTKSDVGLGSVDNTADSSKNVLSATRLTTARTIGGVSFNGTANINLPGVNTTGNQDTTGSAASLTTARYIRVNLSSTSGVNFDGTANIYPGIQGTLSLAHVSGTLAQLNSAVTDAEIVQGSNNGTPAGLTLWKGTQAQYAALGSWDSNTIYVVTST